jgi:hypothetical protein
VASSTNTGNPFLLVVSRPPAAPGGSPPLPTAGGRET